MSMTASTEARLPFLTTAHVANGIKSKISTVSRQIRIFSLQLAKKEIPFFYTEKFSFQLILKFMSGEVSRLVFVITRQES